MRTVKEVSKLTGISVRALHWYDEIGLFKPTATSEKGYRLYDDKALETLQQILFFREFDIPLKDIKAIFEKTDFDRNEILQKQKKVLELKRNRLDRMIASMDDILRGENSMDFEIFSKKEIEDMYQGMIANFPDDIKIKIEEEFGGEEGYHQHFLNFASSEKGQRHYQKVAKLYGNKENMIQAMKYPQGEEIIQAYQNRIDAIMKKLADKKSHNLSVDSFAVREIMGEYGFVLKQLTGFKDEKDIMMTQAACYRNNEQAKISFDDLYGEGMAEYFANAVENFFR